MFILPPACIQGRKVDCVRRGCPHLQRLRCSVLSGPSPGGCGRYGVPRAAWRTTGTDLRRRRQMRTRRPPNQRLECTRDRAACLHLNVLGPAPLRPGVSL
jgi:hypothetical protein